MDERADELRRAHDALAELYAERLAGAIDRMPEDRAVLGLFCDLMASRDGGMRVGDIGCGSGRMSGYLARRGVEPHGVDLSAEMVRVARRGSRSRSPTCATCRSATGSCRARCAGTR